MASDSHGSDTQNAPLRSRFAGDPEMVELIELFVEELPARVETIRSALNRGEFEQLCRITHQLKGASAGYGFDPIGRAAGVVEAQLKSSGPQAGLEQVRGEVDALIDLCKRAVK